MPPNPLSLYNTRAINGPRRTMMTDSSLHLRRLRACLAVAIGYLLIASLGLLLRFEIHRWGIILASWQLETLWSTMTCHLAAALSLSALLLSLRRRTGVAKLPSKIALAALPFLALVSIDRIAGVGYRRIHESTALLQAHPVRIWTNRPGWVESADCPGR